METEPAVDVSPAAVAAATASLLPREWRQLADRAGLLAAQPPKRAKLHHTSAAAPAAAAAASASTAHTEEAPAVPTTAPAPRAALRVLSFNVLADGLAQTGAFAFAPAAQLGLAARAPLIAAEVLRAAPDVGGLAESSRFEEAVLPALARAGYAGVFVPKTHSPALRIARAEGPGTYTPDGVAVIWRRARLRLRQAWCYGDGPVQCIALFDDLADDSAIATAAPRPLVLFSMMHLAAKHSAERAARRLQQMHCVLRRLGAAKHAAAEAAAADRAEEAAGGGGSDGASPRPPPHVIVCGDFNAEWNEAAVQLCLREAALHSAYDDEDKDAGDAGSSGGGGGGSGGGMAPWSTWKIRHKAAGATGHGDGGGAPVPLDEVKRRIDYILHSRSLRARAVWWPPADAEVGTQALPNARYPSDHIALAAELLPNDAE